MTEQATTQGTIPNETVHASSVTISWPVRLYHFSPAENRQSILETGLLIERDRTGMGAVFLTDTLVPRSNAFDGWIVNLADLDNLDIEEDTTTEPINLEQWFAIYQDIPPSRLTPVGAVASTG